MARFVALRFFHMVFALLVLYSLVFGLSKVTPGSPFRVGPKQTQTSIEALERKYNLDDPWYVQYGDYLRGALSGDFGPSYNSSRTVSEIMGDALPVTIQVGFVASAIAVIIGIGAGTIAGFNQNKPIDFLLMLLAMVGISVPNFVLAAGLVVIFSVWLGLLPTGGWGGLFDNRVIIPAVALGLYPGAMLARYTRSSVLEVIRQDYIRTARAKGLRESVVIVRHTLKNALIPTVTIGGIYLALLFMGTFYVELITNVPGIGREAYAAVFSRDYPVLMGIVLLFGVVITVVNLTVDIIYAFLDPRIRYS